MEDKKKYKKQKLNRDDHKTEDKVAKGVKWGAAGVAAGVGICKVAKKVDKKKAFDMVKTVANMVFKR